MPGHLPVNAFALHAQQPVVVDTGLSLADSRFVEDLAAVLDPADVGWIWLTRPDRDGPPRPGSGVAFSSDCFGIPLPTAQLPGGEDIRAVPEADPQSVKSAIAAGYSTLPRNPGS